MRCRICGDNRSNMICPRCGYDKSQNREQYPTLADDGKSLRSNGVLRDAFVTSLLDQIAVLKLASSPVSQAMTRQQPERRQTTQIVHATKILAGGNCGEQLSWQLDESGLLSIVGRGSMRDSMPKNSPWEEFKTKISAVKLPIGLDNIGNYAFVDCENLSSVTIPTRVKKIGLCAFRGCTRLTSITIPDSVMSINEQAFEGCDSLMNITIPSSVTFLGSQAFCGCSSLTNAVFQGGNAYSFTTSIPAIGSGAFAECPLLVMHGKNGSAVERYARNNGISFEETI